MTTTCRFRPPPNDQAQQPPPPGELGPWNHLMRRGSAAADGSASEPLPRAYPSAPTATTTPGWSGEVRPHLGQLLDHVLGDVEKRRPVRAGPDLRRGEHPAQVRLAPPRRRLPLDQREPELLRRREHVHRGGQRDRLARGPIQ